MARSSGTSVAERLDRLEDGFRTVYRAFLRPRAAATMVVDPLQASAFERLDAMVDAISAERRAREQAERSTGGGS